MARTVLVTGVSRALGARIAATLAAEPEIRRVVAVDAAAPGAALGAAEFVRVDLRNPLLARVVADGIDTVVHLGLSAREGEDRVSQKETNVIGTLQLLAACQAQPALRRLVLGSTAAVYGSSAADPAHFPEDWPIVRPKTGFARDALEVEELVHGVGRRRLEVATCILRFTHVLGPRGDTPLAAYLRAPLVPVPFGYEARLQLLHEQDALEAVRLAALGTVGGIVNVAADGVITLGQALRRLHHLGVPVPTTSGALVAALARRVGSGDVVDDRAAYLLWGRALQTTRMRADLGLEPRWTTQQTFDDFAAAARGPAGHAWAPAAGGPS